MVPSGTASATRVPKPLIYSELDSDSDDGRPHGYTWQPNKQPGETAGKPLPFRFPAGIPGMPQAKDGLSQGQGIGLPLATSTPTGRKLA